MDKELGGAGDHALPVCGHLQAANAAVDTELVVRADLLEERHGTVMFRVKPQDRLEVFLLHLVKIEAIEANGWDHQRRLGDH